MKTSPVLLLYFIVAFTLFFSCNDDEGEKAITDQELISKISETCYTYFSTDTLIAGGAHTPFIMVRFNPTAAAVLNNENRIETGETFPEGSIVVKELFNTKGGDLVKQYVMIKLPNDPNSAIQWVWAAYSPTNAVEHSVTQKGVGCAECHATSPNRDGVKLFDVH